MFDNSTRNSGQRRLRMVKRVLEIISNLSSEALTANQLADRLHASSRTINRDLDLLVSQLVVFKIEDHKYKRNKNW